MLAGDQALSREGGSAQAVPHQDFARLEEEVAMSKNQIKFEEPAWPSAGYYGAFMALHHD
jgi:hypothetical protein